MSACACAAALSISSFFPASKPGDDGRRISLETTCSISRGAADRLSTKLSSAWGMVGLDMRAAPCFALSIYEARFSGDRIVKQVRFQTDAVPEEGHRLNCGRPGYNPENCSTRIRTYGLRDASCRSDLRALVCENDPRLALRPLTFDYKFASNKTFFIP
jgi:hypothetical protein